MKIKNVGLAILLIGAVLLIGNGIYNLFIGFLQNTNLSLLVRLGIYGVIFGTIIIIIGLVKERLKDKKDENF
ncbi:MAG: hypothetical protein KGY44_05485 [Halanaerobiales bacterium]|nr:hypothetical protein [Halanaerobiales bacterium]